MKKSGLILIAAAVAVLPFLPLATALAAVLLLPMIWQGYGSLSVKMQG
ncbi:MAG: hypothetical protein RBT69_05275 [Spirochaetia bacterium]|jgi:hypothetical protein|nr:hypothetical protein [Spirochaetia bacterium]